MEKIKRFVNRKGWEDENGCEKDDREVYRKSPGRTFVDEYETSGRVAQRRLKEILLTLL